MIGVIGPADTLASIVKVAEELGLAEICVVRCYADPGEAPRLAEELATICPVLLFSGRLPYVLTSATSTLNVRMEYIPHAGTDLYRTIASLLLTRKYRGRLPRLSIDSIPAHDVAETFGDLDLTPPEHVFSLDLISDSVAFDAAELAAAHEQAVRAGEVELCLTCVQAVAMHLAAAAVPCVRVRHSRPVIREALSRAHLSMLLSQAASTQISVCVVEPLGGAERPPKEPSRQVVALTARRLADSMGGTVLSAAPEGAVVIATRGAVERHLLHEIGDRAQPLQTELAELVRVGIGFGGSTTLAEQNARQALIAAKQERRTVVAFENGITVPVGAPPQRRGPRARRFLGRLADQLGLSTTALQRILSVLREVGASFTVREFAAAYGVRPRSARRIIAVLEERGLVQFAGAEQGPGAGRPQSVYRVNAERIGILAGEGLGGAGDAAPPASRGAR